MPLKKHKPEAILGKLREAAVGGISNGRHLVKKVLSGGMGRVYVVDMEDDIFVSKTILPGRGDLESFAEEAQTWVRMGNH